MSGRDHLHKDDCPAAVRILRALAHHDQDVTDLRCKHVDVRRLPGFQWTEAGVWVDVEDLGWLSSSEKATVRLAVAIAGVERCHGLPPIVRAAVISSIQDVVR